jgi:hypothetical protein
MLGTGIDLEFVKHDTAKPALGEHAADGFLENQLRSAGKAVLGSF